MAAFPGLQYEIDVDIQLVGVSFPRRGWTLFIASDQQTFLIRGYGKVRYINYVLDLSRQASEGDTATQLSFS